MKTSEAGISIIKKNEGCKLTAYLDRVADPPVWTIGYGDTLNVHQGMTISQQEAEDRLAARLEREFEPGVMDAISGGATTQSQFDAMVSLAYNIGVGAFQKSSIARYHRAGDYERAANSFLLYNKAGGRTVSALSKRRAQEKELYQCQDTSPVGDDIDLDQLADIVRAAQREVDVTPDGMLGPKTIAAIQAAQKRK